MNSPVQLVGRSRANRFGNALHVKNWTHTVFKLASLILLCSALTASAVSKSVLDLMVEGRFAEARTLIADNAAGARYEALLEAMTEPDARTACARYRKISEDFPGTDCDSLAQERLLLALDIGVSIGGEEQLTESEEQFAEAVPEVETAETTPPVIAETMSEPGVSIPVVTQPEISPEATQIEVEAAGVTTVEAPVTSIEVDADTNESMTAEMVAEPVAPVNEERVLLSSMQKPGTTPKIEDTPIQPIEPKVDTIPATKGVTVDYQDPSVEKTEVHNASATPELSLVVPDVKLTAPPVEASTEMKNEPVADHEEDMALLEKEPGVKPIPVSDMPHDADARPIKSGDWFVQVGAFGNHDNALKLAAKLRSSGYPVVLVPRESESGTLMQVRVGGYETRDAGKQVAQDLKTEFKVPAVLVTK